MEDTYGNSHSYCWFWSMLLCLETTKRYANITLLVNQSFKKYLYLNTCIVEAVEARTAKNITNIIETVPLPNNTATMFHNTSTGRNYKI